MKQSMRNLRRNLLLSVFLLLLIAAVAFAQEQTPSVFPQLKIARKSPGPVPTLTTEDVKKRNPSAIIASRAKASATSSSRMRSPRPTQARQNNPAFEAAETAWNERYKQVLARVKGLARQADQAELESARSRNAIYGGAHSPDDLNRLNARVGEQLASSRRLRGEAEVARGELNVLLDEASTEGYLVRSYSLYKQNGDPDEDSFRERLNELREARRDAETRAAVFDLRARRVQTNLRTNGCTGIVYALGLTGRDLPINPNGCTDNFTLGRLRTELQAAQNSLASARADIARLSQQIEALTREGLAAGLPDELFR